MFDILAVWVGGMFDILAWGGGGGGACLISWLFFWGVGGMFDILAVWGGECLISWLLGGRACLMS